MGKKFPRHHFSRKGSLQREEHLPLAFQGSNKPTDFPLQEAKRLRYDVYISICET